MAYERSPLLQHPRNIEPESLVQSDSKRSGTRVSSFDLTRGLICLLMAIDHTFFISGKVHPTESYLIVPDETQPYLNNWYHYGLRFVTHTCAPGFCLLMGLGIVYFVDSRVGKLGWSLLKTAKYITIRGLMFVIVGWLSMLPFRNMMHYRAWFMIDIIVTLGIDFIIAGWLVLAVRAVDNTKVRHFVTAGFGIAALLTACLTIYLAPSHAAHPSPVVEILWLTGGTTDSWYVSRFPPLSWLPMVLYGIMFGRLTQSFPRRTAALSFSLFIALFMLFLAVRIPGKWGNLTPVKAKWFRHGAREFFWTNKYCPDLPFLALFGSINHLFISIFALLPARFPVIPLPNTSKVINTNQVLMDIGTSPFVFYFIHMWSLLGIGALLGALGLTWSPEDLGPGYQRPGVGNGWIFWAIYLVFIMYMWMVCRYYGRFKQSKSPESVWRYF